MNLVRLKLSLTSFFFHILLFENLSIFKWARRKMRQVDNILCDNHWISIHIKEKYQLGIFLVTTIFTNLKTDFPWSQMPVNGYSNSRLELIFCKFVVRYVVKSSYPIDEMIWLCFLKQSSAAKMSENWQLSESLLLGTSNLYCVFLRNKSSITESATS